MVSQLRAALTSPRNRITVTLATGRAYGGALRLAEELGLSPAVPMALYNGSVVVRRDAGKIIYRRNIPDTAVERIREIAATYACEMFAYCLEQGSALNPRAFHENVYYWGSNLTSTPEFNSLALIAGQPGELKGTPVAVLLRAKQLNEDVRGRLENDLSAIAAVSVTRSGEEYLEVRPRQSNKAHAIRRIARELGLGRHEVLAIGDNDNDVEMLAWAGIGVSVRGATKAAEMHSRYQSRLGPTLGVVEVMRLVKAARRFFPDAGKASR